MPEWLALLSTALQAAPAVDAEIQSLLHQHWGTDSVQNIAQAAGQLATIATAVQTVAAQKQQAVMPPPAMPHAPGTPMPSNDSVQEPSNPPVEDQQ